MKIYLCPSDKKYHCSWEGQAEDILDHFEKEHDDLIHYNETFQIDLETTSENRLFLLEEEIYLTQIFSDQSQVIMKLRYLGPERLAKKIDYNLIIRNSNQRWKSDCVKITPEGFFQVNLDGFKEYDTELKSLTCSLHVNKAFMDDSSLESVSIEETATINPTQATDINYETLTIGNDEDDTTQSTKIDAEDIERKKIIIEDREETHNNVHIVSVENSVTKTERKADNISISDFRMENENIKSENLETSYLSRSKSTAFEDMRRIWYRTKSTVSLSSIKEIDSPIICTNCSNCLKVPIYICPNNHHFCEKCQAGVCGICEMKITFIRDADLEKVINKVSIEPCQYQKYGCPEKLISNDLHQHEVNCLFCLYKCPMAECSFEGQFKGLCKHLKLIHASTKLLSSFILSFNNYPEAFLANEERGIFYCYVRYGSEEVEWSAKFCGPKERNFFCELKFKDGKLKQPLLLQKTDNVYSIKRSLIDLKRMKIKPKNAVLTITF